MGDRLESRVHNLLAGREVLPAGRLNVLGLDRLRDHFGGRWEKVAPKVGAIARQTIERNLGRSDVVLPCDDAMAYVVLFAELDRREAEVKALFIAQEIARHVLGDAAARATDAVETRVMDLDTAALKGAPQPLAAIRAATAASHSVRPDPGVAWHADRAGTGRLPGEIRLVYRPVWDVGRRVLSTYHCVAARQRRGTDGVEPGYDVLLAGDRSSLISELDHFMLDRVGHDLARLQEQGKRVLLTWSLHAATLLDKSHWERVRSAVVALPPDLAGDLVVELIGVDDGLPTARLNDLVGFLRPKSRALVGRIDLSRPTLSRLRDAGIRAVSFDLSCRPVQEAAMFRRLDSAVPQARQAGMSVLAQGLDRPSLAVAALGAGCDYIEGAAVHPPVETPEHVLRYRIDDLFGAALGGRMTVG